MMRERTNQSGLTLLEVLIAVLILSIGLLGLAGLQTASLRFNTSAYYLSQATALAYDLADRMRANRDAALAGAYNAVDFANPAPACGNAAGGGTIAAQDIASWRNALACALPLGNGDIEPGANGRFTIRVRWDESRGEAVEDADPVFTVNTFELTTEL